MKISQATLTKVKFDNSTELIATLQKHFTFAVDKETEHVFVLDRTNPTRARSREYVVQEDKDEKLYLLEV